MAEYYDCKDLINDSTFIVNARVNGYGLVVLPIVTDENGDAETYITLTLIEAANLILSLETAVHEVSQQVAVLMACRQ